MYEENKPTEYKQTCATTLSYWSKTVLYCCFLIFPDQREKKKTRSQQKCLCSFRGFALCKKKVYYIFKMIK